MSRWPLAGLCLVLACTDPRARPAPPLLDASVAPTFELTSPGTILGSVYMFDSDGLDALELSVAVFGGSYSGDSTILLTGGEEEIHPLNWNLPGGIPINTPVTVVAKVTDFAGFSTSDTLVLHVMDSVSAGLRCGLKPLN